MALQLFIQCKTVVELSREFLVTEKRHVRRPVARRIKSGVPFWRAYNRGA
jgi:hypothetical protein